MNNLILLFIISLTPLLAFAKIWLLPKSQRHFAPLIGVVGTFISWVASILLAVGRGRVTPSLLYEISWLPLEQVRLSIGFFVDHLNLVTLVIVTTISFFVQVFSVAYMYEDESRPRYFSFLSFFVFAMINLVVASNLLQTYLFWELVGLASYLLIGFWFEKEAPAKAARKAFVTTRFGDLGFYLGILLLLIFFGSTSFADLNGLGRGGVTPPLHSGMITTIALLIFCGIAGKSAQAPLHAWLPDAMEGPTPVSALIHSATMVAAGVFLLARLYPFFNLSPAAMQVILIIAAVTSLTTATVATVQNDIKRILAYSTISQLGLMVMGLAAGSYAGGLFHLATHAAFKSLLFLTAGALIHHYHTNDIWEMARAGARRQLIPMFALVVGGLSLAGVVPFAGFWSKDLILEQLLHLHPFWYFIGLAVSFFTSYYTFRLLAVFFFSRQQLPRENTPRQHEIPIVQMCLALPLIVLAVGSFLAGLSGTEYGGFFLLTAIDPHALHQPMDPQGMLLSTLVAVAGLVWAFKNYRAPEKREPAKITTDPVRNVLEKKYFIDHLYENVVGKITMGIANLCHKFDRTVINGVMVNGTARRTYDAGLFISRFQSGFFQDYLFWGLILSLGAVFWILK